MNSTEVGTYWEQNAHAWTQLSRAGYDVYRDRLNTPAFLRMLPNVDGLGGLDLGCGEGSNTKRLAQLGARMTGIDIAPSLIAAAREPEVAGPLPIDFRVGDATKLDFADKTFDSVTAFMSLMDLPAHEVVLGEIFRVLINNGFLQFSILHPCFVPPVRKTRKDTNGDPYAIEIADYFRRTDGEIDRWTFTAAPPEIRGKHQLFHIPRFHRTLSDWINMLVAAGFAIEAMQEPMADEEMARNVPKIVDTRIAPLFLHIRVRKRSDLSGLHPGR